MSSQISDLDLLKRFEPITRYTTGERFFPMGVQRYVEQCSLWVHRPKESPELIVPQGALTLERLAEVRPEGAGSVYYLKFIDPLDLVELARYSIDQAVKTITHTDTEEKFYAGRGRLARVGYMSRFMDALFSLTLLLRGRVPGDTAAAAALAYRRLQAEEEKYCYYGRVVRQNRWVVLQYWFFYPFNNWRSGFFGVNDHEGDWEMISIYCSKVTGGNGSYPTGDIRPEWVAYASHDYSGDDLRRRWDDPEVQKVGNHPVIYPGAGSHASYFHPGEYLTELELPFLNPVAKIFDTLKNIWGNWLRQTTHQQNATGINIFRIPFVDYARGDGLSIGPGCQKEWESTLISPPPPWVKGYRGLWGLFAQDPIAGENAPGGPMYNRDGTVRRAWYDPLAWAGLDKVPTFEESLDVLDEQRNQILEKKEQIEKDIEQKSKELTGLGLEAAAMQSLPHLEVTYRQHQARIQSLSRDVTGLRKQLTVQDALLEALGHHEARLIVGDNGPMRAHIRRAHQPSSDDELRLGGLAEIFSALSVGLLVMSLVILVIFARHFLLFGLAAMIGLLVFIESSFRRRLTWLVNSLSVGLAVVTAFVLLFEFFWQIVIGMVLVAGLYIIWENIREIRR